MANEAERHRLAEADAGLKPWRLWGPYLSERAWGTVREDYSEGGTAWEYFPHDHARSRAYRWSEDGLAGLSDRAQFLCFSLAFWNGRDPILKERIFGLTGNEGNHGEDAKEYWFYLDSTPTHSWMTWRWFYPQDEFPYGDLVAENGRRGRSDREYELLDTGIFEDDRYWDITCDYTKASPTDIGMRIRVRNAGPATESIDVLPHLWFRNTWSWGLDPARPLLSAPGAPAEILAEHHKLGAMVLAGAPLPSGDWPEALFCENETNLARVFGASGGTAYPKDGINDHVLHGAATVNPDLVGTRAALRYRLTVEPGETAELFLRLTSDVDAAASGGERFDAPFFSRFATRKDEADEFYLGLTPADAGPEEAMIMRQAFAGMLWGKQFYAYSLARWLTGDPAGPPPPAGHTHGRNNDWKHLESFDVISMPDPWEYPWFAVWDLAFHCVALAHVDVQFAKDQLELFLREWYLHPNGQVPAYEWAFGDVNPPVHAWAALRVFQIDGSQDFEFLGKVFQKLLINFTWWVNKKDRDGNNVFEGGFLGLDNIGLFDRSQALPNGMVLEQSDGTSWMGLYALNMLNISLILASDDPAYEDIASKFYEHFVRIAAAMNASGERGHGLWNEEDGFYYDVLSSSDGSHEPMRVRSVVGLSPLYATEVIGPKLLAKFPGFDKRKRWFLRYRAPDQDLGHLDQTNAKGAVLLSMVSPARALRLARRMGDEEEFLSPYGLRALSRYHLEHPVEVEIGGMQCRVDYEPAESTSYLFGGNSNWRGPVWFPVNYLLIDGIREYHKWVPPDFRLEHPVGSGNQLTLEEVAEDLSHRLVSLFLNDEHGCRPVFGDPSGKFQTDPTWHDNLLFYEFFHGDTGEGLGASHQTGWTGLVADLITRRRWRRGKPAPPPDHQR